MKTHESPASWNGRKGQQQRGYERAKGGEVAINSKRGIRIVLS